jgi:hypothetical protein
MEAAFRKELQSELKSLRTVLLGEHGHSFLDLFDQFMEQREFGLALHAVCDFLLGPNSSQVDKSTVDQIQGLHIAMEIDDRCVEELRSRKLK